MMLYIKNYRILFLACLILIFASVTALVSYETKDTATSIETIKQYEEALYRAPSIPHAIQGFEDCLSCHKEGINGAPKTPHPDRENCTGCHRPQ